MQLGPTSLRPYDRDFGQAGLLVPQSPGVGQVAANAATSLVANRKYAVRFVPSRDMTIISVGICIHAVEASAGNSAMDCGIFSADGQTLLASSGPLTGIVNATGWRPLTLTASYTVRKGVTYYAALATATAFTGTAATILGVTPATGGGQPFGSANGVFEVGIQQTAGGTLAAPYTGTSTSALVPVFCLRET
jgi:hypothetical protein